MKGALSPLDRLIEAALTLGVLLSGTLLVVGLLTGTPGTLRAGLVTLMLTPVARVVVVALGLLAERDWLFALLALWILGVLLSSLRLARLWQ